MKTIDLPTTNSPTAAEEKQETPFEKTLADPDASSPLRLNVYARTFLGILLLWSIIAFYLTHLSGHGSLNTYGQPPYPSDMNHLTNH